jgi:hypothetical protein
MGGRGERARLLGMSPGILTEYVAPGLTSLSYRLHGCSDSGADRCITRIVSRQLHSVYTESRAWVNMTPTMESQAPKQQRGRPFAAGMAAQFGGKSKHKRRREMLDDTMVKADRPPDDQSVAISLLVVIRSGPRPR